MIQEDGVLGEFMFTGFWLQLGCSSLQCFKNVQETNSVIKNNITKP